MLKKWVEGQQSEALELLSRLVEINSFTKNKAGVDRLQDVLEGELKSLGLKVERVAQPVMGDILVATTNASGSNDLMLVGHADTVFSADCGFTDFVREEEVCKGPGVIDMKGGLVVIIFALKVLKEMGILDQLAIRVVINGDEEEGSPASRIVFQEQAKYCSKALVYEWGREGNSVITRRKGRSVYAVQVQGKAAHAGNRHVEGKSAIRALANFINAVEAFTDYDKEITLNVGKILGGTAANVVPDMAVGEFEVRAARQADLDAIDLKLADVAKSLSVDGISCMVTKTLDLAPLEETESSQELFCKYKQAGAEIGHVSTTTAKIVGGGSNGNDLAGFGLTVLDGLGPVGDGAHTINETMELNSLVPRIYCSARLIQSLFSTN